MDTIEVYTIIVGLIVLWYTLVVVYKRKHGQEKLCWLHRWEKVKDTYIHHYARCEHCGARDVWPKHTRGQPIDYDWVMTGKWWEETHGPPNGLYFQDQKQNYLSR